MATEQNDADDRRQGKGTRSTRNKTQLKGYLEETKENYRRDTIEVVLGEMPPPPPEEPTTDIQELRDILNTYIRNFGLDLFWEIAIELGLRPKKPTDYEKTYGSFFINSEDVVAVDVKGQSTRTVTNKRDWQVKMLEDGYVRFFFKGGDKPSAEYQSFDLRTGDIIKSTTDFITVQHLSQPLLAKPTNPIFIPAPTTQ